MQNIYQHNDANQRKSKSGQSEICTTAVSALPPEMTWTTAGLSPDKGGPPWRKQWPIILPAIRNRSLSTRCADEDGTRWSGSPSKILVIWAFPEKQENKIFCGRTLKKTKVRQCGLKNWWSKGIPKLRWKPHFNFCVVIENKKRFTPSPIAGSPRK